MVESRSAQGGYAELDSVDWAILGLLQVDATIANKDVAARVGIAPSTCLDRVRRLRERGVISSIRAQVDPASIGRGEQAFLAIQLRPHSRVSADEFSRRVLAAPETVALYSVTGEEDFLVHVAVRDSSALERFIMDHLLAMPQVARCRTQLIFGQPRTAPVRRAVEPAP